MNHNKSVLGSNSYKETKINFKNHRNSKKSNEMSKTSENTLSDDDEISIEAMHKIDAVIGLLMLRHGNKKA